MEKKVSESMLFAARDKNGELYFYTEKPTLREDGTFIGASPLSDKTFMPFVERKKCVKCFVVVYEQNA